MKNALEAPRSGPERPAPEQLMATLSHELRTPLNGIIGTASLLADTPLGPHQSEYVATIRKSAVRLLDMLNTVLDFARLEEGHFRVEQAWFDPGALARDVCELLAPRAHEKGLDLAVAQSADVPARILSDAGRLRQILFNLAGNAIKFTDAGSVLIALSAASPNGRGLSVKVYDTGPGIPPNHQGRIFEAFAQVPSATGPRDGGVGLGLAIVQRLVQDLSGTVTVESMPGLGSVFTARFDAIATETTHDQTAPDEESGEPVGLAGIPAATLLSVSRELVRLGMRPVLLSPDADPPSDVGVVLADARAPRAWLDMLALRHAVLVVLRPEDRALIPAFRERGCVGYLVRPIRPSTLAERLRQRGEGGAGANDDDRVAVPTRRTGGVLVADDNPVNALIARRALEKAGFTVTVVTNGTEAVEAALSRPFDLLLMDLRMPLMDGFEAMMRIRAEGAVDLPIVAISAEIDPVIEQRARQCGANAVAAKPLDAATLTAIAQRWSGLGQQAA